MLWMRYWDSRAAFLKLGWKINTALYNSVGFSWFLSSKPEAYLQLHYFQIKVEFMSESTPKDEWVHGVLLASAPPLPIPQNPLSKVQWSSKLLFLSPCPLFFFFFPCVSFCRLFSRPRWDTSAKWVSLRRKRWPPADTSRWPPLPAPGQLHLSFSCKNRKNDTKTNSTFGSSGTHLNSLTTQAVTRPLIFQFSTAAQRLRCIQTISWGTWVLLWNLWHR